MIKQNKLTTKNINYQKIIYYVELLEERKLLVNFKNTKRTSSNELRILREIL